MSDAFKPYVGKIIEFGPAHGTRFVARLLEVRPGWARFEWPNSGGRIGWRNVAGYIVHEVIEA
jgi:hypothetical protein